MEILRRTLAQFRELFQSMSASQRGTLIVVPVMVLAALGLLMYTSGSRSEEFLLSGRSAEELTRAQDAFRKAGLTGSRIDGQRIAVPKKEVERYTAALVVNNTLPTDFAADIDRMHEKIGIFMPAEQRMAMMEDARKLRLAKILRAIPNVEDAVVEWERGKSSPFNRTKTPSTVQVSVRMRGGQELSQDFVRSLRLLGASALAGVSQNDVTVFDLQSGKAIPPTRDGDPQYDHLAAVTKLRTKEYEDKIENALKYIPNVIVTVNVDLDNLKSTTIYQRKFDPKAVTLEQSTSNKTFQTQMKKGLEAGMESNRGGKVPQVPGNERTEASEEGQEVTKSVTSIEDMEKRIEGMLPKSVQVTVSIPEDYYRSVALQRGIPEGTADDEKKRFQKEIDEIKAATEKDVAQQVQKLIPTESPREAISVTSVPRLERRVPPTKVSWVGLTNDIVSQWGGAAALTLCAIWALWMMNRSISKIPPEAAAPALAAVGGGDSDPDDDEPETSSTPTRRDELQSMVRDNPEMAAAVLSRWLSPAK